MQRYKKTRKTKVGYAIREEALSLLREAVVDRRRHGDFISDAIVWYLRYLAGTLPAGAERAGNGPLIDLNENNEVHYE